MGRQPGTERPPGGDDPQAQRDRSRCVDPDARLRHPRRRCRDEAAARFRYALTRNDEISLAEQLVLRGIALSEAGPGVPAIAPRRETVAPALPLPSRLQ